MANTISSNYQTSAGRMAAKLPSQRWMSGGPRERRQDRACTHRFAGDELERATRPLIAEQTLMELEP